MYWYRETQPDIIWDTAQSLCEAMHPNMSLAELDQPGEQTAVIDNYVKVVYPGGFPLEQNYILNLSRDVNIASMFDQCNTTLLILLY